MKVFRLVTEQDGETTRESGGVSTKISRITRYFAANQMDTVYQAIPTHIAIDETVVSIEEVIPALTILKAQQREEENE